MSLNISKIKALMQKNQWNSSELARRMEVSRSEVSRLLTGKRQGGDKIYTGLKRAFPDVPLDSLFYLPALYPIGNKNVKNISLKEQEPSYRVIKHPNAHQKACTVNEQEGVLRIIEHDNLTTLQFPPGKVTVTYGKIPK